MRKLIGAMDRMTVASDLEAISHDIDIILECSELSTQHDMMHDIPFESCMLLKGTYSHPDSLYTDILVVLRDRNLSMVLLDIMPYVDDYIEYFTDM